MADLDKYWQKGLTFSEFLAQATKNRDLWDGLYNVAQVPSWALEAIPTDADLRMLVIAEDWCGDASNTVPILAKLADQTEALDLKIVGRDNNPDLMNEYLTNGSRSIPMVIVLDHESNEIGHWGPRPRELQEWVMANRTTMPKEQLYPLVRRWYARDRGETTLREVLEAAGLMAGKAD
ncbi:MAG TPA: thioredoxin family protein [Gemmatimonadales bacterium]|nr:thioredoxin family protein [Gemmatimonadales bacterium]